VGRERGRRRSGRRVRYGGSSIRGMLCANSVTRNSLCRSSRGIGRCWQKVEFSLSGR